MREIAVLLIGFCVMYLGHEAGHVVVAWSVGWKIVRVSVHPLGGLGFAYDMRGEQERLPMVALGGLAVSLVLTLIGLALLPGLYAFCFAVMNAVMLCVQAAPIPGSDGWQIQRALRNRRRA